MKLNALLPLALCLLVGCQTQSPSSSAPTETPQPSAVSKAPANVIVIVADQMRRASMSLWQQEKYKNALNGRSDHVVTPNLDQLASEGIVFTQAIANYPLCSPFRGMLLSGLYPHNNGVTNNTRIDRPNVGLRTDITTFTEVLAQAGYETALVGKGHWQNNLPLFNDKNEFVGTTEAPGGHFLQGTKYDTFIPPGPGRQGIDYWYQSIGHDHDNPLVYTNDEKLTGIAEGKPFHPKTYSAVDQANVIIDYIRNNRQQRDPNKPFSLLWTMDPPHSPYHGLDDTDIDIYNKYYKDLPIETVLNRPNVDLKKAEKFARIHFSMVTLIDRELGRVLDELKKAGLDENTLIVFTSDHGEMMGSHSKMAKNTFYEESLSIPLLMRLPGELKPQLNDLLISVPDYMPTILGLLSLNEYTPKDLDGIDYSRHLLRQSSRDDAEKPISSLYYGKSSEVGLRTDKYTYAIDKQGQLIGLFNNLEDPYQLRMLSMQELPPEDREMLKSELGNWLQKINHPLAKTRQFENMISYPN